MPLEAFFLYAGAALYAGAGGAAVWGEVRRYRWEGPVMALVAVALLVHGVAIILRWGRLGHGPYVNLFEILSSNVWSLHAALLGATFLLPRLRPVLAAGLPVLLVLVLWLVSAVPVDSRFPVTYDTPWLPAHVWLGKLFLGLVVVAVGCSVVILARTVRPGLFGRLPASRILDEASFRLILLAFVFECLMLVAGAAWAQDAWGRFWQWDPLETWSFLTWLAVGAYLHLRVTRRPPPAVSAMLILGVFVIAFATFFGMPFVSTAPHKGMI